MKIRISKLRKIIKEEISAANRELDEDDNNLTQIAPPGREGTDKKMKKDKDIDNPWALTWHLKNKGALPGKEKKG